MVSDCSGYKIEKKNHIQYIANFQIIEKFSWANEFFKSVTMVSKQHIKITIILVYSNIKGLIGKSVVVPWQQRQYILKI